MTVASSGSEIYHSATTHNVCCVLRIGCFDFVCWYQKQNRDKPHFDMDAGRGGTYSDYGALQVCDDIRNTSVTDNGQVFVSVK